MKKINLLFILALIISGYINAQTQSLEFTTGDGNPTATNGPTQSASIRFRYNIDNPSGDTFQTYNPAVTATFEIINQQYTLSTIATNRPVNIGYNNVLQSGAPILQSINSVGSPSATWYTSNGASTGSGISTANNHGILFNTLTSPFRTAGLATSGAQYWMADLVVTFSQAVNNPIFHIGGMGSSSASSPILGFSQEYDVISSNTPITLTRLSGSNALSVTGTKINNLSTAMDASGTDASGSGSIRINGIGITTLTFRVYVRGDGRNTTTASWADSNTSISIGDGVTMGFSLESPSYSCITSEPGSTPRNLCQNVTPAPLSVTATGATSYQWYYSNAADGGTITTVAGATSASYTPPTNATFATRYYFVTVETSCGTASTYPRTPVTVNANPTFTSNPAASTQTVCLNGTPTNLTVATAAANTYQWYSNTINSNTGGTLISGATSGTFTPPTNVAGTTYYYAVITSTTTGCSTASNVRGVIVLPELSITTQPDDTAQNLCVGSTATTLTVTATGATTYQWYYSTTPTGAGTSLGATATSISYTPITTTAFATRYYYVVASNGTCTVTSSPRTPVTVTANPTFTSNPAASTQTVCLNGTPTNLTVATAAANTYQWYSNTTNSNTGGTAMSGATLGTFTPPTDVAGTTYYYAVITSTTSGCTTASNVRGVIVLPELAITTQPDSTAQNLCVGSTATTLTVTATGATTYQWYYSTTPTGTGTSLGATATSASYTPVTTTAFATRYYYVVASNGTCTVTSSPRTPVTVTANPTFTSNPAASTQTVCLNGTPTNLTVATAAANTYQWYSNTTNSNTGGTLIPGATSGTFTPPTNVTGTTYYYAVITNTTSGCTAASNVRGVVVLPELIITTQPNSTTQNLCVGSTATTLTVTASGATTYQWSYSNLATGGTITAVSGATSSSYTPPTTAVFATRYYFVTVGNGTCSLASGPRTPVTVVANPTFTSNPAASTQTVCLNGTPTNLTVAAAAGNTFQWYRNTTNSNIGGTAISGATSATFTPPTNVTGTTYYYAVITNTTTGCTAASNVRGVIVLPALVITTQPDSTSRNLCLNGASTTLSVVASGATTYQWSYSNLATGGTLTPITGATSSSYTIPTNATFATRYYFVTVGNGTCSVASSPRTPVTVNANPTFTSNPAASTQTVCQNAATTALTVAATGATFQWYRNTANSNSGGTAIPGATLATYTPPSTAGGTTYYYAVITSTTTGCSSASNVRGVTVNGITVENLAAQTICQNNPTNTLGVITSPAATAYQWYSNTTNSNVGGTSIPGATSNSYIPPSGTIGTLYYFVQVTIPGCGAIRSNPAQVNIVSTGCPTLPIGCNTNLYLSQNANTQLYLIDKTTNPLTYPFIGPASVIQYNGIAINPIDGEMYAIKESSRTLIKINNNGSISQLGDITGMPSGSYNTGEFDELGNYYTSPSGPGNTTMYKINVNTRTATTITWSQALQVSDLAYNVNDGYLYAVNIDGRTVRINTTSGAVTFINSATGSIIFGAMFGSPTGIFGADNSGGFYKIDINNGSRFKISDSPASSTNDGAHCPTMPITFDSDLYITKTDNRTDYVPGTTTVYTIVAGNNGIFGVQNALVTDNLPAGIPNANMTYTAVASSGSITSVSGTMTGPIHDYVSLAVGGTVTYTVTVTIPSTFTGNLVNTATITSPADSVDPLPSNNTATDTNVSRCSTGVDSDGDGISDACDLDDDNDGILDTNEGYVCSSVPIVPASITTTPVTTNYSASGLNLTLSKTGSGTVVRYTAPDVGFAGLEPELGTTTIYQFAPNVENLVMLVADLDSGENVYVNYYDQSGARITNLAPYVTKNIASSGYVRTISSDVNYGLKIEHTSNVGDTPALANHVEISTGSLKISRIEFYFPSRNINGTPELYIFNACLGKDTDGDGIPDHLDLDSDGDGCPDAYEGAANISTSQLVTAGGTVTGGSTSVNQNLCANGSCVNTNGLPQLSPLPTGYSNTTGQGAGHSQDGSKNDCLDSDGDGIPDWEDLDDDNDGILDSNECTLDLSGYVVNNFITPSAVPGSTSDNTKFVQIRPSDFGLTTAGVRNQNVSHDYSSFFGLPTGSIIVTIENGNVHPNANVNPASDAFYVSAVSGIGNTKVRVSGTLGAYVAVEHGQEYYRTQERGIRFLDGSHLTPGNLIDLGTQTTTGNWQSGINGDYYYVRHLTNTTENAIFSYGILNPQINPKNYLITTDNTEPTEYSTFFIRIFPECDTDKDGIPNRLDLDSDADGCPDALEGGANILQSDLVTAGGTVSGGSTTVNQNLCNAPGCVSPSGTNIGLPQLATPPTGYSNTTGQSMGNSQNATVNPCNNEGYIYITKKALDENSSVDFNFTVNGGPVTAFTLNDKETTVFVRDLGSSESGRLWAISDNILYYRNEGSSDWVQTSVTDAVRVDGGTGNNSYFTDTAGQVLRYDGVTAPTVIGSPANFGSSTAEDIGSAWNNTPYIITADQKAWIYSGSGTAWTQVGTTTNNVTAIDGDPSTGDAFVTDGTLVYRLTSTGVKTSLGSPGYVDDIAVTSAGEVFSTSLGYYVRKWNSGTTWDADEITSRRLSGRMTGGHKEQIWSANPYYDLFGKIYTRTVSGTNIQWLDDERVRTSNKGNSIMIKVPVGTYIVKETSTSGWELQSMTVYDPTSNSTSDFSDQSVTLNVTAGETVHAVFTNGIVSPFVMGSDCSTVFFEDFGSGAVGSFGAPLTGQTSYHYNDGSINPTLDGYYAVVGSTTDFAWWSTPETFDHTSNDGTGRMMAINASYEEGVFFRRKFTNLVPGKSYKFSAWLMSLSNDDIKPNASFQVVDPLTGNVLNEVSSGDITTSHVWNEYSMDFVPTSTELDLILLNNALGGNGNDIALDDIRFEMNRPQNLTADRNCSTGTVNITSPLGALYEYSLDNINWQSSPNFTGVSESITNFYVRYSDLQGCVSSEVLQSCYCYKPGVTTGGTLLDTPVGITALNRAGEDDEDNWPMRRKGGWIALEAKTKGFVPNRVAFANTDGNPLTPDVPVGIPETDFVEGMMVYDTTNHCLKIYTSVNSGTSFEWYCLGTQTCPD